MKNCNLTSLRYVLADSLPVKGTVRSDAGGFLMEFEHDGESHGVTICQRHALGGSFTVVLGKRSDEEIPVTIRNVKITSLSESYRMSLAPKTPMNGYLNADSGEGVVEGKLRIEDRETRWQDVLAFRAGISLDANTGIFEIESSPLLLEMPAFPVPVRCRFILAALCGCFTNKCTTMIVAKRAVSCIGGSDCTGTTICTLHSRPKGKLHGPWKKETSNKDVTYDPTMDYLCFCR